MDRRDCVWLGGLRDSGSIRIDSEDDGLITVSMSDAAEGKPRSVDIEMCEADADTLAVAIMDMARASREKVLRKKKGGS